MRSFIYATAMDFVSVQQDRTDVAGMNLLRWFGPRVPRLYTSPASARSGDLSGAKLRAGSERQEVRCRLQRNCGAKHGLHQCLARHTGALHSAAIG